MHAAKGLDALLQLGDTYLVASVASSTVSKMLRLLWEKRKLPKYFYN